MASTAISTDPRGRTTHHSNMRPPVTPRATSFQHAPHTCTQSQMAKMLAKTVKRMKNFTRRASSNRKIRDAMLFRTSRGRGMTRTAVIISSRHSRTNTPTHTTDMMAAGGGAQGRDLISRDGTRDRSEDSGWGQEGGAGGRGGDRHDEEYQYNSRGEGGKQWIDEGEDDTPPTGVWVPSVGGPRDSAARAKHLLPPPSPATVRTNRLVRGHTPSDWDFRSFPDEASRCHPMRQSDGHFAIG